MSQRTCIVWFRNDLRIEDNPALRAASDRGAVIPVYIWAPDEEGDWPPGGATRWWLHQSLHTLSKQLHALGLRLILRKGRSLDVLQELTTQCGADTIVWNRRYEPAIIKRDAHVAKQLVADGLNVETFTGSLLFEPGTILNKSGKPFQVFTAFWKTCLQQPEPVQTLTPKRISPPASWPKSLSLDDLQLEPAIDWASGMRDAWKPGAVEAQKRLRQFAQGALANYEVGRNQVDIDGSSRLSPHLHFGELSPGQVWRAVMTSKAAGSTSADVYLAEIGWREFAHHLLFHFPHTTHAPLRESFKRFPWEKRRAALKRWQRGQTGYPIIDAAMRDLWATGFMPNRARMIVASFLTKHLLITWQEGAAWFWDTLVDADLASNTLGWQWTAGCGADAAPYFRVFNPITQASKFDPNGAYIRKWVPEIAALPVPLLFKPWEAPGEILMSAGVHLGKTYPKPIVDHAEARSAALAAYNLIR
ncbi:MAG: deoxyribodipyrimidine photo-lyase [Phycisphaerales bacterium]|nr:deoxyribodipyrimidine photo-lyase [Phycisphaerales bacterium]